MASRIVILTGAGISAESGVPTFRGADGLWEGHRIEDVASPRAFAKDPKTVHRFYNMRRAALKTVEPNAAHHALARLEREFSGHVMLITQNVDDLHDRSGSYNLTHMHGELLKARCTACKEVFQWSEDLDTETRCMHCERTGGVRPHIVWFGETPFHLDKIQSALACADLFAAIGTSSQVYPAAGFAEVARDAGAKTIELNLEPTALSSMFDDRRFGAATKTVASWVAELLDK